MRSKTSRFEAANLAEPLKLGQTLIEASAGTGKTYTVAALYLRLLLEHELRVGEILVTTFTKAATAELRDRIRRLLREASRVLQGKPTSDPFLGSVASHFQPSAELARQRLEAALSEFDDAAIFTIHGFCERTLQDQAFASGAAFECELLPDEIALIQELADDFWRKHLYHCDACASAAATAHLKRPDLVTGLRESLAHPLAKHVPPYIRGELKHRQDDVVRLWKQLRACWRKNSAAIRGTFLPSAPWAKKPYGNAESMEERLAALQACLEDETGFEILSVFSQTSLREKVRVRQSCPEHEFFALCEQWAPGSEAYAGALQREFLHHAPAQLRERKHRLGVQSFNDQIFEMYAALAGSRGGVLQHALRSQYKAALIDEFQDTDALQADIFTRVFAGKDRWLFLVGDPKQAIYGFRGGDVFTYLRASRSADQRYTLAVNYRSTPDLVAATNSLFTRRPDAFILDEIHAQPVSPDQAGRHDVWSGDLCAAPLRIWNCPAPSGQSATRHVVQLVADEILRTLGPKSTLGGRPVRPGDIAVLTASNVQGKEVAEALRQRRIPAVSMSTGRIFDSVEAEELVKLLSAMAAPRKEAVLRAALLTTLLGETAASLEALSGDEAKREEWLLQFAEWHATWTSSGFTRALRQVFEERSVRQRLLRLVDGHRHLTNLSQLGEILQCAEMEERLTPDGLVKWLLRAIAHDDPGAREEYEIRLETDEDAVRIVTMHSSKGLEYNIVFCPFLWSQGSKKKDALVRFHDAADDDRLTFDSGSPELATHREQAGEERLAEGARLLYVALTRARARCDVFWGPFSGTKGAAFSWLLHRPEAVGGQRKAAALAGAVEALEEGAVKADLQELAAESDGSITIVDPAERPALPPPPPRPPPLLLQPRRFKGRIEDTWTLSSFSSLIDHGDADLPDYDPPLAPVVEEAPRQGIHSFPAGTRAGICLHEILEELDFTKAAEAGPLVARKLAAFGVDAAAWTPTVVSSLVDLTRTPLPGGFTLGAVPKKARLTELEFYLPARRLDSAALRAILGESDGRGLEFSAREGWLKGYIDVVFEEGGRFYLGDWKSNFLGSTSAAYSQETMKRAMAARHYGFQLHLYSLALHRYLRSRLPSYSYESNFGGVFYFFLRGIDLAHPERGVIRVRPTEEVIQRLDEWIGTP